MTEPSKEAIERACEMLQKLLSAYHNRQYPMQDIAAIYSCARFIQAVSDASREARDRECCYTMTGFILPDPEPEEDAEADLQEAAQAAGWPDELVIGLVKLARKNGLKISKVSE